MKSLINKKGGKLKKDKYLKVILTIIAICLVWICIRDFKLGSNKLYADSNQWYAEEIIKVKIVDVDSSALLWVTPLEVKVKNWPLSFRQSEGK